MKSLVFFFLCVASLMMFLVPSKVEAFDPFSFFFDQQKGGPGGGGGARGDGNDGSNNGGRNGDGGSSNGNDGKGESRCFYCNLSKDYKLTFYVFMTVDCQQYFCPKSMACVPTPNDCPCTDNRQKCLHGESYVCIRKDQVCADVLKGL